MFKIVTSLSELNTEQLLSVYKEHSWDEQDFLSYLREDFFQQPNAAYVVWIEGAEYKSVARLEQWVDGLLLHSLETAPDERRKGYAYRLLVHLLDHLRTTDCKVVYSHINKQNKASFDLHVKCGFQMYADFARYIDGTVTQNSCTMCYRL